MDVEAFYLTLVKPNNFGLFAIIVSALIGAMITHAYYRKQRFTKLIQWNSSENPLISREGIAAGFEIKHQNQILGRPIIVIVVFWNAGNMSLTATDLPEAHPFGFVVTGGRLLSAQIVKSTRAENNVTQRTTENTAHVRFDFLDPRDGASIEFVLDYALDKKGSTANRHAGILVDVHPGLQDQTVWRRNHSLTPKSRVNNLHSNDT